MLRGGRVFDGTGAPARAATLVIERNKVARLIPPGTSDWPAGAQVRRTLGMSRNPLSSRKARCAFSRRAFF